MVLVSPFAAQCRFEPDDRTFFSCSSVSRTSPAMLRNMDLLSLKAASLGLALCKRRPLCLPRSLLFLFNFGFSLQTIAGSKRSACIPLSRLGDSVPMEGYVALRSRQAFQAASRELEHCFTGEIQKALQDGGFVSFLGKKQGEREGGLGGGANKGEWEGGGVWGGGQQVGKMILRIKISKCATLHRWLLHRRVGIWILGFDEFGLRTDF